MSNSCSTTVLAADDKVRITRFDFDPGQETGWHVHEHNYVITAITDCFMVIQLPDGTQTRSEVYCRKCIQQKRRSSSQCHKRL